MKACRVSALAQVRARESRRGMLSAEKAEAMIDGLAELLAKSQFTKVRSETISAIVAILNVHRRFRDHVVEMMMCYFEGSKECTSVHHALAVCTLMQSPKLVRRLWDSADRIIRFYRGLIAGNMVKHADSETKYAEEMRLLLRNLLISALKCRRRVEVGKVASDFGESMERVAASPSEHWWTRLTALAAQRTFMDSATTPETLQKLIMSAPIVLRKVALLQALSLSGAALKGCQAQGLAQSWTTEVPSGHREVVWSAGTFDYEGFRFALRGIFAGRGSDRHGFPFPKAIASGRTCKDLPTVRRTEALLLKSALELLHSETGSDQNNLATALEMTAGVLCSITANDESGEEFSSALGQFAQITGRTNLNWICEIVAAAHFIFANCDDSARQRIGDWILGRFLTDADSLTENCRRLALLSVLMNDAAVFLMPLRQRELMAKASHHHAILHIKLIRGAAKVDIKLHGQCCNSGDGGSSGDQSHGGDVQNLGEWRVTSRASQCKNVQLCCERSVVRLFRRGVGAGYSSASADIVLLAARGRWCWWKRQCAER